MDFAAALGIAALLILISLLTSKLASWINMPCMLLFLGIGLLAGSEGVGGLPFTDAREANYIGSVAMAFILFSGGFDTSWRAVRPILLTGSILSSLGVLLTALFSGAFAYFFLRLLLPGTPFSPAWCFLLGAVISSTDAAAVFSVLRSKSISLQGKLKPLLEFESGSNDPMAAFLTIFMVEIVAKEGVGGVPTNIASYCAIIPEFFQRMLLGAGIGWAVGKLAVWIYNRIDFEFDGLYHVLAVATVIFCYSSAELLHGNGFLAVYAAGLVMGNAKFIFHNGVGKFNDGLAWLMQVILFTMLGLLAFPMQLWAAKWAGLGIAAFLMFVARPLAVYLCMIRSKFSFADRTLVAWVGLRGGAPIMLATFALMAGLPQNGLLFHIVFFIVLTSVLIQGMTIMPMARALKRDSPLHKSARVPLSFENTGTMDAASKEFNVNARIPHIPLAELALPKGALILLVHRNCGFLIPRGETMLEPGDSLTVMGSDKVLEETSLLPWLDAEEK